MRISFTQDTEHRPLPQAYTLTDNPPLASAGCPHLQDAVNSLQLFTRESDFASQARSTTDRTSVVL